MGKNIKYYLFFENMEDVMKEFKETLEQIENFPKQGLFSRNRKMDIFQNVEKKEILAKPLMPFFVLSFSVQDLLYFIQF